VIARRMVVFAAGNSRAQSEARRMIGENCSRQSVLVACLEVTSLAFDVFFEIV
jgi:hypothetical protein